MKHAHIITEGYHNVNLLIMALVAFTHSFRNIYVLVYSNVNSKYILYQTITMYLITYAYTNPLKHVYDRFKIEYFVSLH